MKLIKILLIGSLFFLTNAYAANSPVVKDIDYKLLDNLPSVTSKGKSSKINVQEFFAFQCIHCKVVDPLIETKLATDKRINLDRIHVVWGEDLTLPKINATIASLGMSKLYPSIFDAVFAREDLSKLDNLKKVLLKNKLSTKEVDSFINVYNSFTISSKVNEYKILTNNYKIDGTPTFIVANKYIVSPAQPERLIEVVQYLVNQEYKK